MAAAASIGGNFLINLTSLTESSEAFQEAESSLFSGSVAVQIIGIGFVVPICEEMVYRGLIYQRMRQFMSVTLSVVMSAVFFGVMHGNIVQGIYAFALGLMLAYAYEKYGSLRAPVLCHISANCVSLLLMYGGVSVESRTAAMITGFAGVAAALAMIVLIDRPLEDILSDIKLDRRPTLRDGGLAEVERVYHERLPIYRDLADITLRNDQGYHMAVYILTRLVRERL